MKSRFSMRLRICVGAISALLIIMGCGDDDGGVAPVNHAPVMAQQSDTTVAAGDTLQLWAVAQDSDGDDLIYSLTVHLTLSELKQGDIPDTEFDQQTGHFSFMTTAEDSPDRDFTFSASDGRGGADSTRFIVNVN